jgi:hypothetical protein
MQSSPAVLDPALCVDGWVEEEGEGRKRGRKLRERRKERKTEREKKGEREREREREREKLGKKKGQAIAKHARHLILFAVVVVDLNLNLLVFDVLSFSCRPSTHGKRREKQQQQQQQKQKHQKQTKCEFQGNEQGRKRETERKKR